MDYRSFYLDLEFKDLERLKEIIKEPQRGIEKFLICWEEFNSDGIRKPHFHVLLYHDLQTYETLLSYLIGKNGFNLSEIQKEYNKKLGHKGSGGYRFYGRARKGNKIETIQKFITYLHKDGNVYAEGIDQEMLSTAHSDSFENPKLIAKKAKQRLIDYLDSTIKDNAPTTYEDVWNEKKHRFDVNKIYDKDEIVKLIVFYILENPLGLSLSSTAVTGYYNSYLMTKTSLSLDDRYWLCVAKNKY